jgi:hypothetical protein
MIVEIKRNERLLNEDGSLTLRAAIFFEELTREVNLNTPLEGVGTPEGVLKANPRQRYMDTTAAAGSVLYIKQSGTGNTGWKLV